MLHHYYCKWITALGAELWKAWEHWASLEEWENGTIEFKDGNEVKIFGMNSLK